MGENQEKIIPRKSLKDILPQQLVADEVSQLTKESKSKTNFFTAVNLINIVFGFFVLKDLSYLSLSSLFLLLAEHKITGELKNILNYFKQTPEDLQPNQIKRLDIEGQGTVSMTTEGEIFTSQISSDESLQQLSGLTLDDILDYQEGENEN